VALAAAVATAKVACKTTAGRLHAATTTAAAVNQAPASGGSDATAESGETAAAVAAGKLVNGRANGGTAVENQRSAARIGRTARRRRRVFTGDIKHLDLARVHLMSSLKTWPGQLTEENKSSQKVSK
jgi:hypothetical protein